MFFFQGKSSICGFSVALCAQVVDRLKQQRLKDEKKEENSTRKGRKPKGKAGKAAKAEKPAKARKAAKAGKAAKAEPEANKEQSSNSPKTIGKRLRRMKSQVRMVSNEPEDGKITQKDKATPSAAKTRNPSSETTAIPTTMSKGKGKDERNVKEAGKTKKVKKGCKVKGCKTKKTKNVKKAQGEEEAMDQAGHAGKGAKAKKAKQSSTCAEPAPKAGEDSPLAFHLKHACLL